MIYKLVTNVACAAFIVACKEDFVYAFKHLHMQLDQRDVLQDVSSDEDHADQYISPISPLAQESTLDPPPPKRRCYEKDSITDTSSQHEGYVELLQEISSENLISKIASLNFTLDEIKSGGVRIAIHT